MKTVIADSQTVINSMRHSVAKALERKRRLGQYAVVSRNGQLVRLQPEDISPALSKKDQALYNQ